MHNYIWDDLKVSSWLKWLITTHTKKPVYDKHHSSNTPKLLFNSYDYISNTANSGFSKKKKKHNHAWIYALNTSESDMHRQTFF